MQTHQSLISIIIPYFNCEKYIIQTLESIEAQTYQNYEVILVNDGSSTASTAYIEDLVKEKPYITYLDQDNKGVSAARNIGSANSQGEFLLFLDAGNKIHSEFLQKTVDVFLQNPQYKIVYTKAEFFETQAGEWQLPEYTNYRDLLLSNTIDILALIKRDDFEYLDGFDESLKMYEDWDFWIRLLKNNGEVFRIDEILFSYRKRTDQSSLTDIGFQNFNLRKVHWQRIYQKHENLYNKYNISYHEFLKAIYASMTSNNNQDLQEIIANHLNERIIFLQDQIENQSNILAELSKQNEILNQHNQGLLFRIEKIEHQSHSLLNSEISSSASERLKTIYKSPVYQIIRTFKKLGWLVRGKKKKPYFYPLTESETNKEIYKILWSPAWSILGWIHAIYALFKK